MILVIVATLVAIVLSLLSGVVYIKFLEKKVYKQYVREGVPESHAKKQGTPTTGGVFIVVATIVASIIALLMQQTLTTQASIILLTFAFYTFTGFKDDIRKIKNR